ncbi:transposase [Streptomyces sp. NPDC050516]|uniref:transposase n=1 Tax=Streptomyces sp. NPDC050516 TaxID=3365621 RepID=UPI0037A84B4E
MSDARWALIEPVFTEWRSRRTGPGVAARVHGLREIVNAILYVNRTGIPWEYLPHDFPPHKTVYDYYAKREADGTTGRVHDLLRDRTRRAHGHAAQPSAAVVDAQSVKTSANVAETSQGIYAGKKILGIWAGDGHEGARHRLSVFTELRNRDVEDCPHTQSPRPSGSWRSPRRGAPSIQL